MKKLSIIISNRNDITMMVVTIRSCIEALKPIGLDKCEIVIVDNSDKPYYDRLKSAIPTGYCRDKLLYVYRQENPCLFTARETAARKSTGEYIICLDSHMLVGHNMFVDLLSFAESHRDDPLLGFIHAPINWAHQHERQSKHDRDISEHELGPWGKTYPVARKITWKGMPWLCRREWFLDPEGLGGYGALSEHSISWGGGDMHIGVKPWLLGFQNWAVPTSPGIHIGPFPRTDSPKGDPHSTIVSTTIDDVNKYRVYNGSGNFPHTFGFLVSCYVLGGEPMMKRNREALINRFGKYIDFDKWWTKAIHLGDRERKWLLSRQQMSFEQFAETKPWNN